MPNVRLAPSLRFAVLPLLAATLAQADEPVERGRAVTETLCARCHAIGTEGASPHREAPPFRTLSRKYPIVYLEEALAEGIVVGHPDMPAISLPPSDIAAVIAYLQSIQDGPAE